MSGSQYSIGKAADILHVPTSTLRYYENEGLLPSLSRTQGGMRIFSEQDIEACKVIDCLKQSGLSIKDIKHFMELVEQGDASIEQRLELFEARRDALLEEMKQLQQTLGVVEYKCWYYSEAVKHKSEAYVQSLNEQDIPVKHQDARGYLRSHEA